MADTGDRAQAGASDDGRHLTDNRPGGSVPSEQAALPALLVPAEGRPQHGIRHGSRTVAVVLCAALILGVALSPVLIGHITSQHATRVGTASPGTTVREFALPHAHSLPFGITVGPDRNVWFTEYDAHAIGRITPQGAIAEFTLPAGSSNPFDIVTGPDGNLWFNEDGTHVGRMTPAGAVTEFAITRPNSYAGSIAAGSDGNLWFTEYGAADAIVRITPAGAMTEFPLAHAHSEAFSITAGPDGNLWFTEIGSNRIGRITPQGTIAEFAIPTAHSNPDSITSGPDRALWFTEYAAGKIARIALDGRITEYPLEHINDPLPLDNTLNCIAADRAGGLWVTMDDGTLARITTTGTVAARITLPAPDSRPVGVVEGADGSMWFTEAGANRIGRVQITQG